MQLRKNVTPYRLNAITSFKQLINATYQSLTEVFIGAYYLF